MPESTRSSVGLLPTPGQRVTSLNGLTEVYGGGNLLGMRSFDLGLSLGVALVSVSMGVLLALAM